MYTYSRPVLGLSAIRSASFVDLVHGYKTALVASGYNPLVVRFHLHSVAHFGVWLELEGAELGAMDEAMLAAFERHRSRCRCRGTSRSRDRSVVSCIRVFLHYLREQGKAPATESPAKRSLLVREFLQWMTSHRGAVETTLSSYRLYVNNLVDSLGDDPQT